MPKSDTWPGGVVMETLSHIDSAGSCDSVISSEDSLEHLSAEERACLTFLEETIDSLEMEEDSGLSTDELDNTTPPQLDVAGQHSGLSTDELDVAGQHHHTAPPQLDVAGQHHTTPPQEPAGTHDAQGLQHDDPSRDHKSFLGGGVPTPFLLANGGAALPERASVTEPETADEPTEPTSAALSTEHSAERQGPPLEAATDPQTSTDDRDSNALTGSAAEVGLQERRSRDPQTAAADPEDADTRTPSPAATSAEPDLDTGGVVDGDEGAETVSTDDAHPGAQGSSEMDLMGLIPPPSDFRDDEPQPESQEDQKLLESTATRSLISPADVEDKTTPQQQAVPVDFKTTPQQQAVPVDFKTTPQQQAVPGEVKTTPQQQAVPADVKTTPQQQAVPGEVKTTPQQQAVPADVKTTPQQQAVPGEVKTTPQQQAVPGEVKTTPSTGTRSSMAATEVEDVGRQDSVKTPSPVSSPVPPGPPSNPPVEAPAGAHAPPSPPSPSPSETPLPDPPALLKSPPAVAPRPKKLPSNILLKSHRPARPGAHHHHPSSSAGPDGRPILDPQRVRMEALRKLGLLKSEERRDPQGPPLVVPVLKSEERRDPQGPPLVVPVLSPPPPPSSNLSSPEAPTAGTPLSPTRPAPPPVPAGTDPPSASVPVPAPQTPCSAGGALPSLVVEASLGDSSSSSAVGAPPASPHILPDPPASPHILPAPAAFSDAAESPPARADGVPPAAPRNKAATLERSGVGGLGGSTGGGAAQRGPGEVRNTRARPASLGSGKDFFSEARDPHPAGDPQKLPRSHGISVVICPRGQNGEDRRQALRKLGLIRD